MFNTDNIPVIIKEAFTESSNHKEIKAMETAAVQMTNINEEEKNVPREHRSYLKAQWRKRGLHFNNQIQPF